LSLRARLAIALRFFHGYCDRLGVVHPEIDHFLECLWDFVEFIGDGNAFGRWVDNQAPLVYTGLGDRCPSKVREALVAAGVPEKEFLLALSCTTEVVYTSMYGAADEVKSQQYLFELAEIAVSHGVSWPDVTLFSSSRWVDGYGWGVRPTERELAIRRAA
jgi:hypothetical protein